MLTTKNVIIDYKEVPVTWIFENYCNLNNSLIGQTEKIKSLVDDKKTRKNEHTFYMESQEAILNQAKDAGFLLDSKIDLINVSYEYQYLYILTKPN